MVLFFLWFCGLSTEIFGFFVSYQILAENGFKLDNDNEDLSLFSFLLFLWLEGI